MPWVWTDELAELVDRNDTAHAADLHQWTAQPIGLAVPPECDLVTFARSLLSAPPRPAAPVADRAQSDCACGTALRSAEVG